MVKKIRPKPLRLKTKSAKSTKVKLRKRQNSSEDVPGYLDTPVTIGHFKSFRQEVGSRLTSIELAVKASEKKAEFRFTGIDSRFAKVDERLAGIDARFAAIDARFDQIDARFAAIDARFAAIDARFDEVDARFVRLEAKMDAGFASILYEIRRVSAQSEEQKDQNRIVYDSLRSLYDRQENLEKKVDERISLIEHAVKGV
jgi:chromosome segregation ATPase